MSVVHLPSKLIPTKILMKPETAFKLQSGIILQISKPHSQIHFFLSVPSTLICVSTLSPVPPLLLV